MAVSPRSRHRKPSARLPRSTPEQIRAFRLKSPRLRLISVWLVLLLAMLGLGVRLAYLQLVIGSQLRQKAQNQQSRQSTPRTSRREMVDVQGNVVAMDRVVYTLYVHPVQFKKNSRVVADAVGNVLERKSSDLLARFAQQESGIKLATDIPEETAKRLQSLRLDGIDLHPFPQRVYPQGDLFSQVTGYVDLEGFPKEGIELSLQTQLRYDDPQAGAPTPLQQVTRDGLQLQLTLDSRLQRIAQEGIVQTVAQYQAKRGAVLVMDSHTGELLTLALAPTYDPNRYYNANFEYFKNWAVSDLYEPGSTFKPINVAIALESDSISPDDTIFDEGRIQIDEWPIQNVDFDTHGGRGAISITDVLRYSSNVGMVHIMARMPREAYYDWLEKLGLNDSAGIDLPGEAKGQIKSRTQFVGSAVESATTAFGQGFSLTPIQMLKLHGTLANGGTMVTPHVVRGLIDAEGELTWTPPLPASPQRVFSTETTQQVLAMMQEVVDDGTGSAAKVNGYQIAGKTGTAQKADGFGGYGEQRITSFVSIVPVSNPRYVVLVVVDEPQGEDSYGGTVAAPLVKTILESLVVLEGVEPDRAFSESAKPAGTSSETP